MRWVALAGLCAAAACQCGPGSPCPNDSLACPAQPPTWDGGVSAIVLAHCKPCHQPGIATKVLLDNYADTSANAQASLNDTYGCIMPPADSGFALSTDDRHQLLLWLACGTPLH